MAFVAAGEESNFDDDFMIDDELDVDESGPANGGTSSNSVSLTSEVLPAYSLATILCKAVHSVTVLYVS